MIVFVLTSLSLTFSCSIDKSYDSKYLYLVDRDKEDSYDFCYLNDRGDTIIPFGKYAGSRTDTIWHIGFVLDKDRRCICIDKNGKELFYTFWFDNGPDPLLSGRFRIMSSDDRLFGYADKFGSVVIRPMYDNAFVFEDSLARVEKNDTIAGKVITRYGIINVSGKAVVPLIYDSISWFDLNLSGKVLSADLYLKGDTIKFDLTSVDRY